MDFSNKESNQQLADYLKDKRQSQSLNLEDVADKIGVPIQHLKNIESGNFERFDTFYLKMYLKKYATCLSLNVEELYQQFYGTQIKKEVEVKIHKQKVQKRNRNLGRLAGIVCSVLVVVLGVYFVMDMVNNSSSSDDKGPVISNPHTPVVDNESNNDENSSEDSAVEPPQTEESTDVTKPEDVVLPTTTVSKISQADRDVAFDIVTDQSEAKLKLNFTAPCWLSVDLGDQKLIAGETYQAGGVYETTISSDQFGSLSFNVGDATAVQILVNDQVVEYEPSTPHQYITINIKTK